MKQRLMLAAAVLLTAASGLANAADRLTVASWGGAYSDSQAKAFIEPYRKAGNDVSTQDYNGEIAKIRAQVKDKRVIWDVIDIDTQTALSACSEGLLEKVDWKKLGLDRTQFIGGTSQTCAVPNIIYATILAYDTTRLKSAPAKTADLFDLKNFPGKRGLQKTPEINLEWALLADGVKQSDLYAVLRTKLGVDRAFRKLDTIKGDVIWWDNGLAPPKLLADRQVVMTSASNGSIFNAVKTEHRPFAIVWDNEGFDWNWWAILKGGPHVDAGYRFISFASDAKRQADLARYIPYGPANKEAVPLIDAATLANLPTAAGNMKTALIVDVKFWADHGDALRERFQTWLAK